MTLAADSATTTASQQIHHALVGNVIRLDWARSFVAVQMPEHHHVDAVILEQWHQGPHLGVTLGGNLGPRVAVIVFLRGVGGVVEADEFPQCVGILEPTLQPLILSSPGYEFGALQIAV
jgi:hypothetical protein